MNNYGDPKKAPASPTLRVDGHDFLERLRGSSSPEWIYQNDETAGRSNSTTLNKGHKKNISSLSAGVFEKGIEAQDKIPSQNIRPPVARQLPPPQQDKHLGTTIPQNAHRDLPPNEILPVTLKHGRSVSWGKDPVSIERKESLQQPSLDGSIATIDSIEQVQPPNSEGSKIKFEDVLKHFPFEDEIETGIIDSADRGQYGQRHRSDTGNSTILTNVPDLVSHEFEITPKPTDVVNEVEEDAQDCPSNLSRRGGMARQESKPLVRKATRHKRDMSVEQTLLSLTEAMSVMHGHNSSSKKIDRAVSSATDFAHDAFRLTERHDEPDEMSPKSGKGLWSLVKDNLPALMETVNQEDGSRKSSSNRSDNGGRPNNGDGDIPEEDLETGRSDSDQSLEYSQDSSQSDTSKTNSKTHFGKKKKGKRASTVDTFKEDWEVWSEFFRPRKERILAYIKYIVFYFLVPAAGIAAILFYFGGNPPDAGKDRASASYILLFCCRQVITFSIALAMQAFIIDFICLGTKIMLRLVGPVITLLIVQSKGWPHILFWWSFFDFVMVSGEGSFAHHWAYYQNVITLLNSENPSGSIVNSELYFRILAIALSVSIVVAVKRFAIALYLGRQTFTHYGLPLAEVMNKMLLVSKVASLAREIEDEPSVGWAQARESLQYLNDQNDEDDEDSTGAGTQTEKIIDVSKRHPLTGSLDFTEKMKLMSLLDQWEEPARRNEGNNEIATISAVLRFRKALTFIQNKYPFSYAFGPADNREACIDSAQEVYRRLMTRSREEQLQFETIALIALGPTGKIDQAEAKALIKLFRPDRQGNLSMLDFVKSVDAVYKEFRLLAATIENSSQIDRAFEGIFNVVFYIVVGTVILSQLGFDPLALFLSMSSVILAFAFMIGSASSKYFEGVLFILMRRPYGIGDLIQVGGIETDASLHGALPWCVANVTLFETELVFLPTQERASLSNGSLANSRIINWARSPQAQFHIFLEFPIDTPFHKLEKFKLAVEEYMKARPREWRALNGFRVNQTFASKNYIEHLIVIQHREAWQHVGQVLDSKANLTSYCQEVARELNMEYKAPILPVDLKYSEAEPTKSEAITNDENDMDKEILMKGFQSIARHKHNIRVC